MEGNVCELCICMQSAKSEFLQAVINYVLLLHSIYGSMRVEEVKNTQLSIHTHGRTHGSILTAGR